MDDLKKLRNTIDEIDQKIMLLLSKRFDVSIQVGEYKKQNNTPVLNSNRETEIINKIENFNHNKEILNVYKTLLKESKSLQ